VLIGIISRKLTLLNPSLLWAGPGDTFLKAIVAISSAYNELLQYLSVLFHRNTTAQMLL
jgi:hypothetical protein